MCIGIMYRAGRTDGTRRKTSDMRWNSDTWTDTQISGHGGGATIGYYRASQNLSNSPLQLVMGEVPDGRRAADALNNGLPVAARNAAQMNKTATKPRCLSIVATSWIKKTMERLV